MRKELALEEIAVLPCKSRTHPDGRDRIAPAILCKDGFAMSIQASSEHNCTPRDDDGPWIEFEVKANDSPKMLEPYLMIDDTYTKVPIDILRKLIDIHGGIVLGRETYSYIAQDEKIEDKCARYMLFPNTNGFLMLQEFLRNCNHVDKKCGIIDCRHCSYFRSAVDGVGIIRNGDRAFCPFTAITHKGISAASNDAERVEAVKELLDLLHEPPKELKLEDL